MEKSRKVQGLKTDGIGFGLREDKVCRLYVWPPSCMFIFLLLKTRYEPFLSSPPAEFPSHCPALCKKKKRQPDSNSPLTPRTPITLPVEQDYHLCSDPKSVHFYFLQAIHPAVFPSLIPLSFLGHIHHINMFWYLLSLKKNMPNLTTFIFLLPFAAFLKNFIQSLPLTPLLFSRPAPAAFLTFLIAPESLLIGPTSDFLFAKSIGHLSVS